MLGGLALFAAGCGDDGSSVVCGAGTTEVNGVCQPDGDNVTCAAGTVLQGTECVPDGTVICETGTTYDDTTGTCVADISGCAAGTVLVSGECVPEDDTLVGDVTEPAEPNGFEADATPGLVTLPAVGDDVVIEGCVEPRPDYDLNGNTDGDIDVYVVQPTGPTLLEITVDGVGGMSGAFNMFGVDAEGQLLQDGWSRLGLNLVGDTTQRQVFLPKAGTYVMMIGDSRTFAFGQGVGDGTTTCYYATLANVAIPSPTAISGVQQTGTLSGDAQFFSYDPAEGDVIETMLDKVGINDVVTASLVTMVDDTYIGSVETASPAFDYVNGLADNSNLVFVVEEASNLGLTATDFTLDLDVTGASAMPADATVSVAGDADNYYYFDVATAGSFLKLSFDDGDPGNAEYLVELVAQRNANWGVVAEGDAGDDFAYFPAAGRYYLKVSVLSGSPGTIDAAVTREELTVPDITQGTGATAVPFVSWETQAVSTAFVTLSATNAQWLSYTVSGTQVGDGPYAYVYPLVPGVIGVYPFVFGDEVVDGAEQIFGAGGTVNAMVQVFDFDPGNAGGSPSFDIAIDDADFSDLASVSEASPVDMNGVAIGAAEAKYYLFNVGEDTDYTITATPDGSTNVALDILDAFAQPDTTVNSGGDGVAEEFSETILGGGYLAFGVAELNGSAGTFDLDVTAVDPSYSRAVADVDLVNACVDGVRMDPADFTDGVSTAQSIGFDFDFYGVTNTELYVTDRGWLTFTAPTNSQTTNFDDAIAPLASDNFLVDDICIDTQATFVTVQWRGNIDDGGNLLQARFQATLYDDGSIDLGYAADNEVDATNGLISITDAGDAEPLPWRGDIGERTVVTYTPKP